MRRLLCCIFGHKPGYPAGRSRITTCRRCKRLIRKNWLDWWETYF